MWWIAAAGKGWRSVYRCIPVGPLIGREGLKMTHFEHFTASL